MEKVIFKRDARSMDIPLPAYETPGAAGMDVRSCEEAVIPPGERKLIHTGLRMEIPEGMECQVRPRSGLAAKHGVTVLNAPGTVDSDYRGELMVLLINHGSEDLRIARGDRIAQLVFARVERMETAESDDLSETTRGSGGFGHSGVR